MEIQPVINAVLAYQKKLNADIEQFKYYKIINDKENVNRIIDTILKDKEELGKLLNKLV